MLVSTWVRCLLLINLLWVGVGPNIPSGVAAAGSASTGNVLKFAEGTAGLSVNNDTLENGDLYGTDAVFFGDIDSNGVLDVSSYVQCNSGVFVWLCVRYIYM
jgi:hypothetical protein